MTICLKSYRLSSFSQQEHGPGALKPQGIASTLLKLPKLSMSSGKSYKAKPNNLQSERTLLIRRDPIWSFGAFEEARVHHRLKRSQ